MFEAIVVGAGHAGVEAAMALAHGGKKTALVTISFNHIANMPCNPSVGGPAKGIVVREVDALGGVMPRVADRTALQFKMLNTTKGPGVWSMRVQSDKDAYSKMMQDLCMHTANLTLFEDIVEEVLCDDNKKITGVRLLKNGVLESNVVVLTTGTYMDSCRMVSANVTPGGPDNEPTTKNLSESLRRMGIKLFRLKTGTPPRVKTSTIDFSKTSLEPGTNRFIRFCQDSKPEDVLSFDEQVPCYLTYTTEKTKEIVLKNLNKSSMYSGVVKGVGPRYCPSFEDKIVRFSDKERHQLFLEPLTIDNDLTYVQGFSTSMPYDVQEEMVHSVIGLENCEIVKYAYAIEYDAIDPLQVKPSLEMKEIDGLFIGGQILGTSGYEEAAGLGMMAGINALRKLNNKNPLILKRDEAYIGVMIDDLVTKGTKEPYRLLTSRAEYRLLMRHDNAEDRLIKYGYEDGLISEERYQRYLNDQTNKLNLINYLKESKVDYTSGINTYLNGLGYDEADNMSHNAYELVKRPGVELKNVLNFLGNSDYDEETILNTQIEIRYEGYIVKARKEANKMLKMDSLKLPQDIDYSHVDNLRLEARQKLNQIKPFTLGQASRISGINPADINVLAVYVKEHKDGK